MVLWGGLKPIVVHALIDLLALIILGYVVTSSPSTNGSHQQRLLAMLGTVFFLVMASEWNFTNKWTIIFPTIPLITLQIIRQSFLNKAATVKTNEEKTKKKLSWTVALKWIIGFLSFCLLFMAGALTLLFPTVELPVPDRNVHTYHVGVVDVFLPSIDWKYQKSPVTFDPNSHENEHFAIRILYPTIDDNAPQSTAYLRPYISKEFCEVNMKYGAPPPLRSYDWIVHMWRLIQLPLKPYAQPLDVSNSENEKSESDGNADEARLPIIVYSPGLGGTLEMYSYQTYSLASQGYVVVIVEHGDGSMAVLPQKNGTVFRRNDDLIVQDWEDGNKARHHQGRKAMTEYRSEEMLAAAQYIIKIAEKKAPELEAVGVSFVGKLNTNDIHYMGHSFGGATSFHAARKASIISKKSESILRPISVIAHEPASDWIPDTTRGSLFDKKLLKNSPTNYSFWTSDVTDKHSSIHDDFDILVLFSHEWSQKNWGGIDVLQDMQHRGVFGRRRGKSGNGDGVVSRVEVVDSAHHIEFSDIAMITPTWLARAVGLTGEKNPRDTARDIHMKTLKFLQEVRELSS